jgi:hypothetical protein
MRLGKIIRSALIALGGLAAVAAVWLATLVFPAKPSAAKSLVFDGFIGLPASEHGGALSVLDYLSISDRTLFVTSESDGAVYEVALDASPAAATASVRTALGPPAAHGVVVDPVSGLAFVSRSEANRVDAYDPATLKIVKSIPVADDVDGVFFDPKNQLIYAVHGDPHLASVIDPKAAAKVATIDLGAKPEAAAYDPGAGVFYQALNDANAIAVLDLAKRSVTGRFPLPGCIGPTSVAADVADKRLFVVCSGNSQLVVVDLATHGVIAHLPVARTAKLYGLPIVVSTVNVATGRNAPTIHQLTEVLGDITPVDRTAINAWEDADFVSAVQATGRKKLIMVALWTEVCLVFPALDAMKAGFEVYPVIDAVGGTSMEAHQGRPPAHDPGWGEAGHLGSAHLRTATRLQPRGRRPRLR